MRKVMGWSEFKQDYPNQADKFQTLYRVFVSFTGNCVFYADPDKIIARDIGHFGDPWVWRDKFGEWDLLEEDR